MHVMRLMYPAQVTPGRGKAMADAAVDQHVMDEEIGHAIADHPQRDAEQRRIAPCAEIEQRRGDYREQNRKQIVALENAAARTMMRFMDKPQGAMHDVTVDEPGAGFHADEADDENTKNNP